LLPQRPVCPANQPTAREHSISAADPL
jgi:hypothetical protein